MACPSLSLTITYLYSIRDGMSEVYPEGPSITCPDQHGKSFAVVESVAPFAGTQLPSSGTEPVTLMVSPGLVLEH